MSGTRKKRKLRDKAAKKTAHKGADESAADEAPDAESVAEEGALEATIEVAEESADSPLTQDEATRVVESLLFASNKPLSANDVHRLLGKRTVPVEQISTALDALVEGSKDRGIVVYAVAGGYQMRTHPASSPWVQKLIEGRPVRLSRAQLETLALIAYRQPITRPEIDEIRGVDSAGTLRVLLDRSLIRILGKKEEPGRPLLYGTTSNFLEFFNLADLRELPTLREYSELSEDSMAEVERLGHSIDDEADPPEQGDDDGGGSDNGGGGEGTGGGGIEAAADGVVSQSIVAEGSGAFITDEPASADVETEPPAPVPMVADDGADVAAPPSDDLEPAEPGQAKAE